MLDFLQFIFGGFWTWAGTTIIIAIVAEAAVAVAKAATKHKERP